jgi:hypothetical protein
MEKTKGRLFELKYLTGRGETITEESKSPPGKTARAFLF